MSDTREPDVPDDQGSRGPSSLHAHEMTSPLRPAYYAGHLGGWGDWWTLLHPPYTAWNLSYVVIGATLAPHVMLSRLLASLLALFLAVGLAAHALDELKGRPLGTQIPSKVLIATTAIGLGGAVALGIIGLSRVGWVLVPFMVLGPVLVVTYNLELFGGFLHNGVGLGLSWGSFTVLVGYVAQTGRLALSPLIAAAGAYSLINAQRWLSARARLVRRQAVAVEGHLTLDSGERVLIDAAWLLSPLEKGLRAMSWGVVLLATSMAVARLG